MGLAGFCRNCLSDWIVDAGAPLRQGRRTSADPRHAGGEWKARYQTEATPEQLARMEESLKLNGGTH